MVLKENTAAGQAFGNATSLLATFHDDERFNDTQNMYLSCHQFRKMKCGKCKHDQYIVAVQLV